MKKVTALRPAGPGRVVIDLDGAPWRRVSVEAAVGAGLAPGVVLDRRQARRLGQALRREAALGTALKALHHGDHTVATLDARLAARGIAPRERSRALETLTDSGLVDDARVARSRAATLAERGCGDAMIRDDLERRGITIELVEEALAALEPEPERARALATRCGGGTTTIRSLAAKGFAEDSLEQLVAILNHEALG